MSRHHEHAAIAERIRGTNNAPSPSMNNEPSTIVPTVGMGATESPARWGRPAEAVNQLNALLVAYAAGVVNRCLDGAP